MEDKLLLGLLYLDKKFRTPADIEELLPHIELVLKIASQRESFSEEEEHLLRKLLYRLNRFEEVIKERIQLWNAKLKVEGRA
jgi:hypothetical protein